MNEKEALESTVVYENKWLKVREDKIRRSSGAEGIYGVVSKPDFVAIVPIHDGYIHLVEQYRYPMQGRYWEIPQGSRESYPGADSANVAAGELREETGLNAKNFQYVGHIFQAYGYSNQGLHVHLATNLEEGSKNLVEEEEG
ncbi:MAG: NUDIX hydrolase [Granulosicoccaceae bacterium]